jgi:glycosyltransferase involved in cell wall biosynthesis
MRNIHAKAAGTICSLHMHLALFLACLLHVSNTPVFQPSQSNQMKQALLTIAIPTYNRYETLCANITRIVPQLSSDVCLLVVNNASTDKTHDLEAWVLSNHPDANIRVVRNITNVGAGANVTRIFELVETPWVWTLMDDDPVDPGAVMGILAAIDRNPTAASINMQSTIIPEDIRRPADLEVHCASVADLATHLDYMPNLLLSSTGVYRVAAARTVLRYAYISLNTVAPHIAIMLSMLEAGLGDIVLSGHTVVTHNYDEDAVWATEVWLAVADVFTLVRDQKARAILLRKYTQTHPKWVDTRKLLKILLPLMMDASTRQMAISDYLYSWSKRLQFTNRPVALLFISFALEAMAISAVVLLSMLFPFRPSVKPVTSDALLRTAIDGRA